jgi:hypothetical protein
MIEKKEESFKVKGTIDSLDWLRKWLHNRKVIEMMWKPETPQLKEHWTWMPTENCTVYVLYGGAIIGLTIFMWIYR